MCVLTETWLKNNAHDNQMIEDFQDMNDYSFIRRDRSENRRGGGVAICFKPQYLHSDVAY